MKHDEMCFLPWEDSCAEPVDRAALRGCIRMRTHIKVTLDIYEEAFPSSWINGNMAHAAVTLITISSFVYDIQIKGDLIVSPRQAI